MDDSRINLIEKSVKSKLQESIGLPVVFDLIEVIREHLTISNLPSGQCVVCLYGFQDGDEFTKTECYHFLHSYCLARHLTASKKNYHEEMEKLPAWQRKTAKPYQAVCPVCRESINDNIDPLKNANPPTELENAPTFQLTSELKKMQNKMADLFLRQKSRGGIIDLDAVDNNIILLEDEEDINEAKNNIENINETPEISAHQQQQQQQPQAVPTLPTPNPTHQEANGITPNVSSRKENHHHHHQYHKNRHHHHHRDRDHHHRGRHHGRQHHGSAENTNESNNTPTSNVAATETTTQHNGRNNNNNRNRRSGIQNHAKQSCSSTSR